MTLSGNGADHSVTRTIAGGDGGIATVTVSPVNIDQRALGEPDVPRVPRPTTAANPSALTHREMEVLALLVAGLSNSAIAAGWSCRSGPSTTM